MSLRVTQRLAIPRFSSPIATSSLIHCREFSQTPSRQSSQNPPTELTPVTLDWPTYLSLRRSQRRYGLLASIPTTFAGFFLGATYFATIEAEPTDLILGIEPIYAYGAATLGCVGIGWLSGPFVGTTIWRLTHQRLIGAMETKDREFFAHISKNRVDPSRQSVTNPVPDYYAERVGSLKQYRQWLRDQSAYNRKSAFGDAKETL